MKRIDVITRRKFLTWGGLAAGGALTSGIWKYVLDGRDFNYAYAEELLDIGTLTKGKLKVGDVLTKENVDSVKDLLAPGNYKLIKEYGERVNIVATETNPLKIQWKPMIEATERNLGKAILDNKQQLWAGKPGVPWLGGTPFPAPKTGLEVMWNFMIRKSPYDDFKWVGSAAPIVDLKKDEKGNYYGKVREIQSSNYYHINTVGRILVDPKPYIPGYETEIFRYMVPASAPFSLRGVNILGINYLSGEKLPESYVYVPALRRVRKVSSTERFESPDGGSQYLSDYDFHSDPVLTWTYKLVGRKPMLAPRGNTVIRTPKITGSSIERVAPQSDFQLRPEVYVLEAYPTGFPRAPYSKKVLYMEPAANFRPYSADIYDRAGNLWRTLYACDYAFPTGKGGYEPDHSMYYAIDFLKNDCTWRSCSAPGALMLHNKGYKMNDYFTTKAIVQMLS